MQWKPDLIARVKKKIIKIVCVSVIFAWNRLQVSQSWCCKISLYVLTGGEWMNENSKREIEWVFKYTDFARFYTMCRLFLFINPPQIFFCSWNISISLYLCASFTFTMELVSLHFKSFRWAKAAWKKKKRYNCVVEGMEWKSQRETKRRWLCIKHFEAWI